jgi:hypothetical protein
VLAGNGLAGDRLQVCVGYVPPEESPNSHTVVYGYSH